MHHFTYRDEELFAEEVPVRELAERFGTPLYVYSHATLTRHVRRVQSAFSAVEPLVAYSVKANPNLAVIRLLANEGTGADVVSVGELERALRAGVPAERIVFSGVGKREDELVRALEAGILQFNVEVSEELDLLSTLAVARGVEAGVAIRVNPDVDAETHRYIATGKHVNKFGIPIGDARVLFRRAAGLYGVRLQGVACHIGSQILKLDPFRAALSQVAELVRTLRDEDGISLTHVDVGGGLGVRYRDEEPPSLEDYAATVIEQTRDLDVSLILEPGRVIAANAGVLVTRVLYRKEIAGKRFVIVDAGMNDLGRPALYGAYHDMQAVKRYRREYVLADVVGPICETSDFLVQGGEVPDAEPGELLVAMSAGAYGRSMSSSYNSRLRAAEVLVRGSEAHLIQERETLDDLWARERIPEFLQVT